MVVEVWKNGFLGSDEGQNFETPYAKAKAVIVPFGLESTVSYGRGTGRGPRAIIEASHEVETFDEQLRQSVYKCGVATLKQPKIPKDIQIALRLVEKSVRQVLTDGKFPIILGGEHSLTQGVLRGVCKKYRDITVLQFDAHSDMKERYHGTIYSHAAVMHQSLKNLPIAGIAQVGIRNLTDLDGELEFRKKNTRRIKTFWAWQKITPAQVLAAINTKNVFISFDVDAFDPSIMPATGTPEPGGLLWWQTLEILQAIFKKKNVIGADIVELAPIKGLHAPDFMIARLVYKMIGYKLCNKSKHLDYRVLTGVASPVIQL